MCNCVVVFFGKMHRFILPWVTFVVSIQGSFSASIPSYEVATEEDIRSNLVSYGSDLVEGLTPPLLEAENHFNLEWAKSVPGSENPYVVEIHRNFLSIKTTGFPSEKIKLNETETEGIQKLSLSFVELLNSSKLSPEGSETSETTVPEWSELNPVIILTNTGISIQFLDTLEKEENVTEISSQEKLILWDFLTKYARNIFEEKLKELKLTEKYAEVFESPLDKTETFAFQNFLDFMRKVMKFSVDYAETAFQGWTTSQPDNTATEEQKKVRSSTATLFAYEELSPFHEFPSQEFQYRRKDIDSIFYGRGVI